MNTLTSEQCWTISSYLRTAAERFEDFADLAMQEPANPGLRDQFHRQHDEAKALADKFAVAEGATLAEEV